MAVTEILTTGAVIGTLEEYIEALETRYKDSSMFGENFRTGADSVAGHDLRMQCELVSDLAAVLGEAIAMQNPDTAIGTFLSEAMQINGITRNDEVYSTVTVNMTAEAAGTTVTPTNTQVSDGAGAAFKPVGTTVIAGSATEAIPCIATVAGAVEGAAGTIETIDVRPYGLASCTNPTDADVGVDAETDPQAKARRRQAASVVGTSGCGGIERALKDQVSGLTDASVTITTGKYLRVIVEGGLDADIAEVLHRTVAAGTLYAGTTTVNYTDSETGQDDTIKFYRVVTKPIYVTFEIEKLPGYTPAGGDNLVIERTVDLFRGDLEVNGEAIPRPRIGEDVEPSKISIGADSVGGCYVRNVYLGFAANPTTTDALSIEFWQRATTAASPYIKIVDAP